MTRTPTQRTQRFNHVALTVAPDLLDAVPRKEILSFYAAVFGWEEVAGMTVDGSRLVLRCHLPDQFVFLVGGTPITTCAEQDHFGLAVGALDELEDIVRRARDYREQDERVEVTGVGSEDHGEVRVHRAYVRYLLPMSIETQHFEALDPLSSAANAGRSS